MTTRIEHLDSPAQLEEKIKKLHEYREALHGKALQLQEKEKELAQKELQLKLYRRQILIAIRDQISKNNSYEENIKILDKYKDILRFISKEIQDDLDEIMV